MALLNWANAFAGLGEAAQKIGSEGFKNELEKDKVRLADELVSKRELESDARRQANQIELLKTAESIRVTGLQSTFDVQFKPDNVAKALAARKGDLNAAADISVDQAKRIAANEDTRTITLGKDRNYLASLTNITNAKMSTSEIAAAKIKLSVDTLKYNVDKELSDAKTALKNATTQEAKQAAKQKVQDLEYSSKDDQIQLQALSSLAKTSESLIASLTTRIADISISDDVKALLQKQINDEKANYNALLAAGFKQLGIPAPVPTETQGRTGWDSDAKKSIYNGVDLGPAKTKSDSDALIAAAAAKAAAAKAAAPAAAAPAAAAAAPAPATAAAPAPAAPAPASAAAPAALGTQINPRPMVTSKEQAVAGQYYETLRGTAKWNGTRFVTD
jgi:hypothetical protein